VTSAPTRPNRDKFWAHDRFCNRRHHEKPMLVRWLAQSMLPRRIATAAILIAMHVGSTESPIACSGAE
jgi:hypothetical protein